MQVQAQQGDTLDRLVWRHLGTTDGGTVEATLAANPHLLPLGTVLTTGTTVTLVTPATATHAAPLSLWD